MACVNWGLTVCCFCGCCVLLQGEHNFSVAIPSEPSFPDWNLKGQTVTVTLAMSAPVSAIKAAISGLLGNMPANKMQLKSAAKGFLKDSFTLAHYNLAPADPLSLHVKTRGRRR